METIAKRFYLGPQNLVGSTDKPSLQRDESLGALDSSAFLRTVLATFIAHSSPLNLSSCISNRVEYQHGTDHATQCTTP